ncbi:proline--tRNA ligase [Entomospira culicis]|uniref:Proline--tRNA ligase n=1 Tax=Entomospira culicis TaxID=2719989 RepID=A0A968GFD1_9SPIO|nr:proline--tRNA ligase [Entomospira culicis]NIZ19576.1 proline--tRNA ligase [Entomospira culicis]NIZ69519.1 proline--tRNA ligase [Entomospira culicis]WDI36632.1 proline--tRNA ligase [Entomospira culicis]WDI38261.1 proline--tRNA ligase [Entomospira culicis]
MAEKITPRAEDYSQWYIDLVTQAELADYAPVKGCMIIRPRGYAIWEVMQRTLDDMFKAEGVQNCYFPTLIPYSFLQKEAEHVEGFSPEVLTVTHSGEKKLEEPLALRPTSETIIWHTFKKWVQSHRDLPLLINQWANVFRAEMRPRLFLRTVEFLWQEGHTAHATAEEANEFAKRMIHVYQRFVEDTLAIPVMVGVKSDSEKFPGAVYTYSIEAMMQDGKALQAGTSHDLGDNFGKAFEVQFQNKEGKLAPVYASSWGVSTRLMGALIMTHSDDKGLVLPPKLAPTQVVIVPIFKASNKDVVLAHAQSIYTEIKRAGHRVILDDKDGYSPGWKFAQWELAGVPLRIEFGERDMQSQSLVVSRRDRAEKESIEASQLLSYVEQTLATMQNDLFLSAKERMQTRTKELVDYPAFTRYFEEEGGFALACWCGDASCETKVKTQLQVTIRNLPFIQNEEAITGRCVVCGEQAKHQAIWSKSY